MVTCVFKDDGRVLSVFAKRARGLLARHVVRSRAKDVSELENFTDEGYRLDTSQSEDRILVFTRSKQQRLATPQASGVSKARTPEEAATTAKGKKRPAPDTAIARGGKSSAKKAEKNKSTKKQTTARGRRPDRGERA